MAAFKRSYTMKYVCRPVIPFVDYERIRLLSENTRLRGRRLR